MVSIYADLVTGGIGQLTEIKKTIEKWPADEILSILVSFNRATSFFCILGEVLAMFTILSFRPPRNIFQTCSDGVHVGFEEKYLKNYLFFEVPFLKHNINAHISNV
jgi:hypothetical protein